MSSRLACLLAASLSLPASLASAGPLTPTAPSAAVAGADGAAAQQSVKALVNAIRYSKDEVAQKRLGVATMAQSLLGPTWAELTPAQRDHVTEGLRKLLVATSFPRGRELFAYLDALMFAPAVRDGATLKLGCTIVVHRELKKVEMPITWVLGQEDGAWKVVDIVAQNDSTCAGIREEEVLPLLKEGGVPKLLAALDARVAKVAGAKAAP